MNRFVSGLLRLRRGPWEMVARSSSRSGVVMLMQPLFLSALHLFVRGHA